MYVSEVGFVMSYRISQKDMRVPPSGSPSAIPTDLTSITAQLDEGQRLVVETLALAAQAAGKWIGVCIRDVYIVEELKKPSLTFADEIELGLHAAFDPNGWLVVGLHAQRSVALAFQRASQGSEALVTITQGYAYPTQRLADLVCS